MWRSAVVSLVVILLDMAHGYNGLGRNMDGLPCEFRQTYNAANSADKSDCWSKPVNDNVMKTWLERHKRSDDHQDVTALDTKASPTVVEIDLPTDPAPAPETGTDLP